MLKLLNDKNYQSILSELKEYALLEVIKGSSKRNCWSAKRSCWRSTRMICIVRRDNATECEVICDDGITKSTSHQSVNPMKVPRTTLPQKESGPYIHLTLWPHPPARVMVGWGFESGQVGLGRCTSSPGGWGEPKLAGLVENGVLADLGWFWAGEWVGGTPPPWVGGLWSGKKCPPPHCSRVIE